MGILGSIGTAIGSGIGKAAGGIEGGATLGVAGAASVSGLARFDTGPSFAGGISAASFCEGPMPVNSVGEFESIGAPLEGLEPMGKIDLGTLDLKGGSNQPGFNLGGEILFQAEPVNILDGAGAVAEAESILGIGRVEPLKLADPILVEPVVAPVPVLEVIAPQVMPQVEPMVATDKLVHVLSPAFPALEPAIDVKQPAQAVAAQPALQEEEVEEIVEEKVEKRDSEEVLEEGEATERKIIVEDGEVTAQRKLDIKVAAVKKAQELAMKLGLKKIPGCLIALFVPVEYPGVRSGLIKEKGEKGPDGSYQETVEAIARAGEFESVTAAQENVDKVIADKKPGKYGKNGTQLAFEHVARIFKYRIFKSAQPYEEVISRVVKKKVVIIQPVAAKPETNLRDFPKLNEVFPQAA